MLCDADGTLFPSEEPAFEASLVVLNRFLAQLGIERPYEPDELRPLAIGRTFRSIARLLAGLHDRRLDDDDLSEWVAVERDVVTAHLNTVLGPDPDVSRPLTKLARHVPLAIVTSSAATRLRSCLEATDLLAAFDPSRVFTAESSAPRPVATPLPAVHAIACDRLRVDPAQTVAVEDSVNGVRAAVSAGCWTVGLLQFVPADERSARAAALRASGAMTVVEDWRELARLLSDQPSGDRATRSLSEPA